MTTAAPLENPLRDLLQAVAADHPGVAPRPPVRPEAEGDLNYVIYITPRSGSTWLAHLLKKTEVFGFPDEWLNFNYVEDEMRALQAGDLASYLRGLMVEKASSNGVFGIEISLAQLRMARELDDFDALMGRRRRAFYLRRRNLVRQAISLYLAFESNAYHSFQMSEEERNLRVQTPYDARKIGMHLEILIDQERKFEAEFEAQGVEPERLYYEELQESPQRALRRFANILGLGAAPPLPADIEVEQLDRSRTQEWEDRFRRDSAPALQRLVAQRPPLHASGRGL